MQAFHGVSDDDEYADCRYQNRIFSLHTEKSAAYFLILLPGWWKVRFFFVPTKGGFMTQVARTKTKYVPAWVTPQQYEKLAALKVLRGTSINGVVCELIDTAGVQIVMPQNAKNDGGVRQDLPTVVLP
jgi:hypothetical protein